MTSPRARRTLVAVLVALSVSGCKPVEPAPICVRGRSFDPVTGEQVDGGYHLHPMSPTPPLYVGKRNPYSYKEPANAALGEPIYRTRCASCHGDDGLGCGSDAARHMPPPADLRETNYTHDDPYVNWRIHEGGDLPGLDFTSAMPAYRGELTDDEIWRVITYLRLTFIYR